VTEIDSLLDAYPALAPAERARADARLASLGAEASAAHAEAYAQARRLAAFADALDAALGPADLGRLVAAERMGFPGAAAALDDARAADPELDLQVDALAARLQALAADAEDPVARFERLAGRRLAAADLGGDSAPARPPVLFAAPRPTARLRLVRLPRWAAAAAAVLLVAYGGLFAVSSATVPERAQVAALGEIEAIELPTLRGAAPTPADALTPALGAVADARRSTLGLFPRYDAAALASAAEALTAVAADADPRSAASQEARLALGRIYLYQGRDAEAVRVLGGLVAEGRYQAPTARRLLDYVRAQE